MKIYKDYDNGYGSGWSLMKHLQGFKNLGGAVSRLYHAIFSGNIHCDILNQRKFYFNVLHPFILYLVFNGPEPCNMTVQTVDR